MAVLVCAAMLCQSFVVAKAAETGGAGASGWRVYSVSFKHKSVEFSIENVESAQDAFFVIQPEDGTELMELPFSIKNATDHISIDLPGEDYYNNMSHITANVGFQDYEGVKDEKGNIIIDYPTQEPGTSIRIECRDDYGCTQTFTQEVSDEKAN